MVFVDDSLEVTVDILNKKSFFCNVYDVALDDDDVYDDNEGNNTFCSV